MAITSHGLIGSGEGVDGPGEDRPTTTNEISACEPMATLAQCAIGIVSVGLNALAVVNPT